MQTQLECEIRLGNIEQESHACVISKRFDYFFLGAVRYAIGGPIREFIFWEFLQNKFSHWTTDCVPIGIGKKVLKSFGN